MRTRSPVPDQRAQHGALSGSARRGQARQSAQFRVAVVSGARCRADPSRAGAVTAGPGGAEKTEDRPHHLDMQLAPRCTATSKRSRFQRRAPAVKGHSVCRMHGAGGGAPIGNTNRLKHGAFSADAIQAACHARALVRMAREAIKALAGFTHQKSPETGSRDSCTNAQPGSGRDGIMNPSAAAWS
jgi:hypothetical protein